MSRYAWVLLGLGLALSALAASRVWVRVTVRDPVLGLQTREVAGSAAAPALSACALVAMAATLVLLLTRRRARVGGLIGLAGSAFWAVWLVAQVMRDPVASARAALTEPGLAGASVDVVRGGATAWPWVCLVGTVLVLGGTAWVGWVWRAASRTPHRPPSTARPQRDPGPASPLSDAERARRANHEAWTNLSEGKDPTD